ncbi:MAG: amidohydrolase family protein [Bacteroidales bacterium]
MKIIDAHMHVGLAGFDGPALIRAMEEKGVAQTWLLTWEELDPPVPSVHMDLPTDPMLELYAAYPDRLVPFYAPDPSREGLRERFEQFRELGIRGCGELKVSRNWADPLLTGYLELVSEFGWPLIFHMEDPRMQYIQEKEGYGEWVLERLLNDKFNGVSRYYLNRFSRGTGILKKKIGRNQVRFPGILSDVEGLEQRLRQYPAIRFIGHGPDFWNRIAVDQDSRYIHQRGRIRAFGVIDRLLEQYDNLFCDISGHSGFNALNRDKEKAKIFLQKHTSKVLYGTDNTRLPLMDLLHSFRLGNDIMDRILYRNAQRVLGG